MLTVKVYTTESHTNLSTGPYLGVQINGCKINFWSSWDPYLKINCQNLWLLIQGWSHLRGQVGFELNMGKCMVGLGPSMFDQGPLIGPFNSIRDSIADYVISFSQKLVVDIFWSDRNFCKLSVNTFDTIIG